MSSAIVSTNSLAHVDEVIARKQAEVHQQILSLLDLRARRNTLLPIFRLPPETLAMIFVHGARDYHKSDEGGLFTTCIPTWVNVSYVCSHWRRVALNCPTLWAYHFNVSLRWTKELLLRSKEVSLKISCVHKYRHKEVSWWPSLLDNLLEHSKRIQELCLDVSQPFPTKVLLCAPHLEKLQINILRDFPTLSIEITDGGTLCLRALKLTNCSLSWYSLNLSGLETLFLYDVHSPSPLNTLEFFATLGNMQNLATLHLEHALPSAHGFDSRGGPDGSPKIHLPRLTFLAIIAPLSRVISFLSCIDIPLKTRLRLNPVPELGSSIGDYAPISSFLAQRFHASEPRSSSPPTFRSLLIYDGEIGALSFRSLDRDCGSCDPLTEQSDHSAILEITLEEENERREESVWTSETGIDRHHVMRDICSSLPLNNVQTLHVLEQDFSSAIWTEMFGQLNGLRYLRLTHGGMPNLSMLFPTTQEPKENSIEQLGCDQDPTLNRLLAPALEELELEDILFAPDDNSSDWTEKSLLDAVSIRKGLQDRLTMSGCYVP